LEGLSRTFASRHFVKLPSFLAPDLLQTVRHLLRDDAFKAHTDGKIGKELCLEENDPCVAVLNFALNSPGLCELLRRISGQAPIESFYGRLYRMMPGGEPFGSWHNDIVDSGPPRLLAISINLSAEPYSGGMLQIRERASKQIVSDAPNTGFGDAIVFRIDMALQH